MPICKALYNQVCIDLSGFYKPCCSYKGISNISVNEMSPDDFLQSDYITNIRKNMEGDLWDLGCYNCEKHAKLGLHSVKDSYDFYCKSDLNTFEMLELSVSNKCNNQCRMCDSRHSSLWQKTLDGNSKPISHYNLENVLYSIKSNNIKIIKYLGGEPLITDEVFHIFEFIKKNKTNNISFYVNTNLTVPPEKYFEYFSHIDSFTIGYSIDGIGLTNEYIRDGSKWKTIKRNLDKWENYFIKRNDKSERYVHTVLQAYNYHDIKNINKLCQEYGLYHNIFPITYPTEFSINALPQWYIEKHMHKETEEFLKNYNYNNKLFVKLVETTSNQDIVLKKSISNFIPELKFLKI
jgi:MoaA/NifB/PqqE/SkfB family radical SAM enzyme